MPARAGNDIKWSHTCLALTSYRMTCSWQLCCIAYQDPIVHRSYYVGKKCMRGKEAWERGGRHGWGGRGVSRGEHASQGYGGETIWHEADDWLMTLASKHGAGLYLEDLRPEPQMIGVHRDIPAVLTCGRLKSGLIRPCSRFQAMMNRYFVHITGTHIPNGYLSM